MSKGKIELLDSILAELDALPYGDGIARDALMKRAAMLFRRICGQESEYVADLGRIRFSVMYAPAPERAKVEAWQSACGRVRNLVNTIKEEIELFDSSTGESSRAQVSQHEPNSAVFVVHGHDEELKQSVARTIDKLGLEPVILHEKPNKGRTIIEKFQDHSEVGFAVCLLSADDLGRAVGTTEDSYRARQNVILELGFFLGRLGRERVAAIYRPHDHFELPSDYSGVLFIEYDNEGAWRFKLAKELKACGYRINIDSIL
jgi:predicted nucleotide-binding protein